MRLAFVGGNNQFGQLDADGLRRAVAEGPLRGRIELHDPAGLVHQDDAVERDVEDGIVASPGVSRIGLRQLARANLLFERRRAVRRLAHLRDAATAGDDEEDVFEDDPGGVLHPAPLARDQHAVDRLRPEGPAQHVIQGDDDGGRNQHPPVAIEGEKGERPEDVKMGFDASAGEVDEQRAHQHLRDGDGVARRGLARSKQPQESGNRLIDAADDDRRPDVQMRATDGTGPGKRRHPQREHDAGDPLEPHQPREQPVGALVDVLLVRGEQLARSTRHRSGFQHGLRGGHRNGLQGRGSATERKQGTAEHGCAGAIRRLAIQERDQCDRRPALSPACPRAPVMPPLKSRAPRVS